MAFEADEWSESRLTGLLALDAGSSVDSLLVLSLGTRQILYHRNLSDPTSAALASFDAWTASANLYRSDSSAGAETLMVKIYKPAVEGSHVYKAIYSDGTFLLCADVSRPVPA